MFAYPCPFCSQRLLASPERAGQRTICPKCLKPIVIPRQEMASDAEVMPAAAEPPVPATAGDDGEGFMLNSPAAEPAPGPMAAPLFGPPDDTPPPEPKPPARLTAALPAGSSARPSSMPPLPTRQSTATGTASATRHAPAPPPAAAQQSGQSGMVVLTATGVESADLAADLATELTIRMKPPEEPPGDLRLSTGLWLTLTAVGGSLWLYSLLYAPPLAAYAALIAVVLFAIGYGWVVYLAGRRDTRQGVFTLFPPVAIDRLVRPRTSQGYRPLRFVLSGVILFALVLLAPAVRPKVQAWAGLNEPPPPPPLVPAEQPPAARLKELAAEKNDHLLLEELRDLSDRNAVLRTLTPPAAKADLVAELRKLLKFDSVDVRMAALKALVGWIDDDAKPDVIAAVSSLKEAERHAALDFCRRWKDSDVAKAVAARLTVRDDVYDARKTLLMIGRDGHASVVEDAILPLLATDDEFAGPVVEELSREFGGARTVAALKKLEEAPGTGEKAKQRYRSLWLQIANLRGLKA